MLMSDRKRSSSPAGSVGRRIMGSLINLQLFWKKQALPAAADWTPASAVSTNTSLLIKLMISCLPHVLFLWKEAECQADVSPVVLEVRWVGVPPENLRGLSVSIILRMLLPQAETDMIKQRQDVVQRELWCEQRTYRSRR